MDIEPFKRLWLCRTRQTAPSSSLESTAGVWTSVGTHGTHGTHWKSNVTFGDWKFDAFAIMGVTWRSLELQCVLATFTYWISVWCISVKLLYLQNVLFMNLYLHCTCKYLQGNTTIHPHKNSNGKLGRKLQVDKLHQKFPPMFFQAKTPRPSTRNTPDLENIIGSCHVHKLLTIEPQIPIFRSLGFQLHGPRDTRLSLTAEVWDLNFA